MTSDCLPHQVSVRAAAMEASEQLQRGNARGVSQHEALEGHHEPEELDDEGHHEPEELDDDLGATSMPLAVTAPLEAAAADELARPKVGLPLSSAKVHTRRHQQRHLQSRVHWYRLKCQRRRMQLLVRSRRRVYSLWRTVRLEGGARLGARRGPLRHHRRRLRRRRAPR